jgi:hypothetical protein
MQKEPVKQNEINIMHTALAPASTGLQMKVENCGVRSESLFI